MSVFHLDYRFSLHAIACINTVFQKMVQIQSRLDIFVLSKTIRAYYSQQASMKILLLNGVPYALLKPNQKASMRGKDQLRSVISSGYAAANIFLCRGKIFIKNCFSQRFVKLSLVSFDKNGSSTQCILVPKWHLSVVISLCSNFILDCKFDLMGWMSE